ncbi:MAG: UbiX family flavin prenyltransferase [Moorellales bacterium]
MRLVLGISGATGSIYGIRTLQVLSALGVETHLVMTSHAERNILIETSYTPDQVRSIASYVHDVRDVGAPPASGSFLADGMIVAPCSIKTLSAIANSYNDNLLVRAADVTLKERRKLVLVVRETPLHLGHLELMSRVVQAGAVLLPPVPAFYHHPRTIEDLVDQTVGKILDQFGLQHCLFKRWDGACGLTEAVPVFQPAGRR